MLLALSLGIMLVLTLFSIILGESFIGTTVQATVDNSQTVNGSTSTLYLETEDYVLNISAVEGALVIIILIITLAVVLGINILGSGLSDESVRIVSFAVIYSGIWGILSVLARNLIIEIEIFGSIIYISLTFFYVIGVIRKMSGG